MRSPWIPHGMNVIIIFWEGDWVGGASLLGGLLAVLSDLYCRHVVLELLSMLHFLL